MNGLLQDLRYSLRSFQKRPGFALLAILILGLGGGATTVIFTLISSVLLNPLKYPEPERLVAIHIQTDQHGERWGFSYEDFLDVQHEARSFENVAAWGYSGGTISAPGPTEYVDGRRITSQLFPVAPADVLVPSPQFTTTL